MTVRLTTQEIQKCLDDIAERLFAGDPFHEICGTIRPVMSDLTYCYPDATWWFDESTKPNDKPDSITIIDITEQQLKEEIWRLVSPTLQCSAHQGLVFKLDPPAIEVVVVTPIWVTMLFDHYKRRVLPSIPSEQFEDYLEALSYSELGSTPTKAETEKMISKSNAASFDIKRLSGRLTMEDIKISGFAPSSSDLIQVETEDGIVTVYNGMSF